MTVAGKQDLKCSAEWHFAASFMLWGQRRECKEGYWRVGESKAGTGLQGGQNTVLLWQCWYLPAGYSWHLKGVNPDAQEQWRGLP